MRGDKLQLEAARGAINLEIKEAIRMYKAEVMRALSPPDWEDFVYGADRKPVQFRMKHTDLIYEVRPMDEACREAGYCQYGSMPGGWCEYYPVMKTGRKPDIVEVAIR
ncbi:Hypothetical protein LUCI_1660 [Lucifera butyrica]|uniref:Uncharacterized protein n=1 Tax=Lucifera butyrica TaxID=1351585 RepID=A0A498RBC1_9FIRM|nr:hypothetical protein [Lucifera butyrica]VBB06428.1 Hypothetical protein LUCI_1660 [Lucifera butyrica]